MAVSTSEPRKQPQQDRSRQMYHRILDASLRILRRDGASGFTTTKVADEARISVGSLYQYFPNKQALIVALHDDDIAEGWQIVNEILANPKWSPRRKLTEVVRWFFESEADEASTFGAAAGELHVFLRDHGARQRDADLMVAVTQRAAAFISASSATHRSEADLAFAADHLVSTVEALAKMLAMRDLSRSQRQKWANHTAAMLADYLNFTT